MKTTLRSIALEGLEDAWSDHAAADRDTLAGPVFAPKNPPIPRAEVSRVSRAITEDEVSHLDRMARLRRYQKHMMWFLVRNANPPAMRERAGDVVRFNLGAVLRIFDVVGGTMAVVAPEEVAAAEAHVRACLGEPVTWTRRDGSRATATLLPFDDEFPLRARCFLRAQQHVLDELLAVQFEHDEGPSPLTGPEKAMGYLLLWVVVHALDGAWTPPAAPDQTSGPVEAETEADQPLGGRS